MTIDTDKLKDDLKQECYGGFFVGGYGAAMMESFDYDRMSPEEIVEKAQEKGVDLRKYIDEE